MKHVTGVDYPRKDYLLINYWDDTDPVWIDGRKLSIYLKAHPNLRRLCSVTSGIFELLLTKPEVVAAEKEVLRGWVEKLFEEGLLENPGIVK